jgi:hypothetical protein
MGIGIISSVVVGIGALTVIILVAVLPSPVLAVIIAVPSATAETSPCISTIATDMLSEDHVTVLSVALLGRIVALSCLLPPTNKTAPVVGLTFIPDTATVFTVTGHAAVFPFMVFAVIVTAPAFTPLTMPLEETVATFLSLLDHLTD